jgi:hypothetical protein
LFAKNVRSVFRKTSEKVGKTAKKLGKLRVKGQVHEQNQFSVRASQMATPPLLHTPHGTQATTPTARDLSHLTPNFYPIRLPIEPLLASYVTQSTVSAVRHLQTITLL